MGLAGKKASTVLKNRGKFFGAFLVFRDNLDFLFFLPALYNINMSLKRLRAIYLRSFVILGHPNIYTMTAENILAPHLQNQVSKTRSKTPH